MNNNLTDEDYKRIRMVTELDLLVVHRYLNDLDEFKGLKYLTESTELMIKILSYHGTESKIFKYYILYIIGSIMPSFRLKAIVEIMNIKEFNIKKISFSNWVKNQNEKIKHYKKNGVTKYVEKVFINEQFAIIAFNNKLQRVNYEIDLNSINTKNDVSKLIEKLKKEEWCCEIMIYELISKLKSNAYKHFITYDNKPVDKKAS